MRILPWIAGATAALFVFLVSNAKAGTPYAPLLDGSKAAGNAYLQAKLKAAEKSLPDAGSVPVAPYESAAVFAISDIASVSETRYQSNSIVFLATTDPADKVVGFYQGELAGWKNQQLKNGAVVMWEKGDQKFWGGQKLLEATRVEILDLTKVTAENTGNPDILKLMESFPEMGAVIKVYYEKSQEDLMAVDKNAVIAACIAHEVESKGKMMGVNAEDQAAAEYLKTVARNSCAKVDKACSKDTNGRRCQRYARLYQ